ncbi:DUF3710 domain-containing protein [Paraoerskovia marina]|uniref:DUF3710 domain-containing protein n=1 Tax=Paraoerskovia marina TaxID=545619 RepID=UPI000492780F|nr:DUF3710 domain-containing protein [Paraoerskovia marina]
MPLFRRRSAQASDQIDNETPAGVDGSTSDDAAEAPARGPFDSSQVTELGGRVDLGAIWFPAVRGMELRMEADKKTRRITGAACAIQGSGLQVQAFAAPRTAGIWDTIREEIGASVTKQGGAVDDIPGPFGRELLARLPVKTKDGKSGFRPARFVGVDGPRWFLRGVITGRAAVEPEQAKLVEAVFANIVVVRDEAARPPRDLLSMHMPGQPEESKIAPVDGPAPTARDLDPLTRGPEIAEIQ